MVAAPGLIPVKRQVPASTRRLPPSASAATSGRLTPQQRQAHIAEVTEYELLVDRKRSEATLRDITGQAVCAVKHALRQSGAQADGRPAIPANWDSVFKPQLGSFMKFVLGRPDQFRVTEGSGPGFYTVENIAGNRTVQAPTASDKGKGKGKSWFKGKGKFAEESVMGKADEKGKGKVKGKSFDKGSGKFGGKAAYSDSAPPATPARATHGGGVLPRAARLLAQAAKEELGVEDGAHANGGENGVDQADPDEEMEDVPAEEEEEAVDPLAEEAAAEAEFAAALAGDDAEDTLEAEPEVKAPRHGSLISSMFGGSSAKRARA